MHRENGNSSCGSLSFLCEPRSVAVVGAGRQGLGRLVLDHLISEGYSGHLSVVHPILKTISGVQARRSVADFENPPELIVVAVGREKAVPAIREFATAGTKAAIVLSAGFSEIGEKGQHAQAELVTIARDTGLRILGPNCMGFINTSPEVRLHASFGVAPARPGEIALVTQSGSVGDFVLYHADRFGFGLSFLASFGNECDVRVDELIHLACEDERTAVITCYFEQPVNPRALLDAISSAARKKPVIVLRGGRTETGAAAAASHTGRIMERCQSQVVDSLLEGAGAHLATCLEELMVTAVALNRYPSGCTGKTAVITNAGGPAVLAVDELSRRKIEIFDGGRFAQKRAGSKLPSMASLKGPVVDLTASATEEHFASALEALSQKEQYDGDEPSPSSLLCLLMSPEGTDPLPIVKTVIEVWQGSLALSLLARGEAINKAWQMATARGIPTAVEPRLAVAALDALRKRKAQRERAQRRRVLPCIEDAVEKKQRSLLLTDSLHFCAELGLPVVDFRVAHSVEEVSKAASEIGYPVVLKLDTPSTFHKTDVGLVTGSIETEDALRDAALRLLSSTTSGSVAAPSVVVQPFVEGVELLIGAVNSEPWGQVLMVGFGGTQAEAIGDVAFLSASASVQEVEQAFLSLRGAALLGEFRGSAPTNLEPAIQTAAVLSALASTVPIIYEIEVNPFMAARGKSKICGVVDARVVLRCGNDGN